MKTKAISWTLAGLVATQNVAFANTDRTQGIGDQAILNAQMNLTKFQEQMLFLDNALAKTAEDIKARDNSGGITNALSISGAALGLGLSALSYFVQKPKGGGAAMLFSIGAFGLSMVAAIGSSVMGLASQGIRPDADTSALDKEIQQALEQMAAAQAQSSDQKTKSALEQINTQIKKTAVELQVYQNKQNNTTRSKLLAQTAQLLGAALSAYVIVHEKNPRKLAVLGPFLMITGNLGTIVSGLTGEQADLILHEIQVTRESLKSALEGLK